MARRQSTYSRRDPNIVVEDTSARRTANGRRQPAPKKNPPFIIIGTVVLAVILMSAAFIGLTGKRKPKPPTGSGYTSVAGDPFQHEPEDELPWGPVHVGMTKQQVLALGIGKYFDSVREGDTAAESSGDKEMWVYTVERGRGGILREGAGAKLMLFFRNSTGQLVFMKHPQRAVPTEDGKSYKNEMITLDDLKKRYSELYE